MWQEYKKYLEEEIQRARNNILMGVEDMNTYKFLQGELEGLKVAHQLLTDIKERMKEDDS